jgi:hypothetical protein
MIVVSFSNWFIFIQKIIYLRFTRCLICLNFSNFVIFRALIRIFLTTFVINVFLAVREEWKFVVKMKKIELLDISSSNIESSRELIKDWFFAINVYKAKKSICWIFVDVVIKSEFFENIIIAKEFFVNVNVDKIKLFRIFTSNYFSRE